MQKDDVRQKCDDVGFLLGGDAVVAGDLQKADEVVPLGDHRPQDGEVLIVRIQDGALFRQRALIGVGDRLVDGDAVFPPDLLPFGIQQLWFLGHAQHLVGQIGEDDGVSQQSAAIADDFGQSFR